jgi:hypothetical protein
MPNDPQPLTPEELDFYRRTHEFPRHLGFSGCIVCRLLATLDAERARIRAAVAGLPTRYLYLDWPKSEPDKAFEVHGVNRAAVLAIVNGEETPK